MRASLPEDYDGCIIGRTVSAFNSQNDRLVYSISGLLCMCEGVRDDVAQLMKDAFTEHGQDAPVFVDDEEPDDSADLDPDNPEPDVVAEKPRLTDPTERRVIIPFPGTPAMSPIGK